MKYSKPPWTKFNGNTILDTHGKIVCTIHAKTPEEFQANLSLVSASPDLLNVLLDLLAVLQCPNIAMDNIIWKETIHNAREAISKALIV